MSNKSFFNKKITSNALVNIRYFQYNSLFFIDK